MRRREFITLLGGAAAAWPLAARAQQPAMPLIGVISWSSENDPEAQRLIAAFKKGLERLGWIEGRNIEFDFRWPAADPDRIRAHAVELIGKTPSVILVNNTPTTRILHQETRTVPVVFVSIADPVRTGLVASLASPGGNLTGLINFESTMGGKWLGLLKEIAPDTRRAGLLFNPSTHSGQYFGLIETAAHSLGMEAVHLPVKDAAEIDRAAAALAREGNASLIIMPDAFTYVHRDRIIALAMERRLPTMYPFRFFVAAGGLISYGFDETDLYRRAASFVDRILKGAKPASIPVELPTKFELVVNLRVAKELGLKIPESFLQRANEVIE
jgi:putative ABC transport system substrate-binding protein